MSNSFLADPNDTRLQPNPWNSNVVSPANEAKLDESLKRLGIFKPILVREKPSAPGLRDIVYEILGGQHRWESACRLGLTEISIHNLGPIDDRMAKEISLADNARYGVDDTLSLADLLKDLGDTDELQGFLPYSNVDLSAIFAASDIALDDLELEEPEMGASEAPTEAAARAPKTHAMMRFKVPIPDAERITELLAKIKRRQGFTTADDLTNAGDALVHALLATAEPE